MAEKIFDENFDFWAHNERIQGLRQTEFSRLGGKVYVDHAGAALYPGSLVQAYHQDLLNNVYANPHTRSEASRYTGELVDAVRNRILQHLNTTAEEYSVIFTAGATASLKLLAESFRFNAGKSAESQNPDNDTGIRQESQNPQRTDRPSEHGNLDVRNGNHAISRYSQVFPGNCGCLAYLDDNHTSVIGMREIAKTKGARCLCVHSKELDLESSGFWCYEQTNCDRTSTDQKRNNLFVFPAMSNFSGQKYPLDLDRKLDLEAMHSGRWFVCIDGAAFLATSPMDLGRWKPDFLTMSFYKMFGFPTGLGALLVRKSAESVMTRNYFGGGTVEAQVAHDDFVRLRRDFSERFEDGTVPFLDIIAVHHAFKTMDKLSITFHQTSLHTFHLARLVHHFLTTSQHDTGLPLAVVYTPRGEISHHGQGGVLAFNLLRRDGAYVGSSEVSRLSAAYDIELRTGCFCNIGACQRWLNLPSDVIRQQHEAGHVCGDDIDLIDGHPTGAVRISFGFSSTQSDAEKIISFIRHCFLAYQSAPGASVGQSEDVTANATINQVANRLLKINVYPIKSCGAFQPVHWYLTNRGLLYDRDWAVVTDSGVCLSQKREPKLCLVRPHIDREKGVMTLRYHGKSDTITVPLDGKRINGTLASVQSKVCGDRIRAFDCGNDVATWLSDVIGRPGLRLVQYDHSQSRHCKKSNGAELSLANETQYLLLASASCRQFHHVVRQTTNLDIDFENLVARFRANLLISSSVAGAEERWTKLTLGRHCLEVVGQCQRCQVICLDQSAAARQPDLWTALRDWRSGHKLCFGIQLQNATQIEEWREIRIGDEITVGVRLDD